MKTTILAVLLAAATLTSFAQSAPPATRVPLSTVASSASSTLAARSEIRNDVQGARLAELKAHRAEFALRMDLQQKLDARHLALMDKTIALETRGKLTPEERKALNDEMRALHAKAKELHEHEREFHDSHSKIHPSFERLDEPHSAR